MVFMETHILFKLHKIYLFFFFSYKIPGKYSLFRKINLPSEILKYLIEMLEKIEIIKVSDEDIFLYRAL